MNPPARLPRLLKMGLHTDAPAQIDRPQPHRLIDGNPVRQTLNLVDVAATGRLYCGVWRSEPGHWAIVMGAAECELFTVLQGRCRVHSSDGSSQEAGPGEAVFIPAGFTGSFEVIEAMMKTYAVVDAQA